MRSGENARKNSLAHAGARRGSSAGAAPRRSCRDRWWTPAPRAARAAARAATPSAAATMKEMSGSLDLPSGVGTQMTMASASPERVRTTEWIARRPLCTSGRQQRGGHVLHRAHAARDGARCAAGSASTPITLEAGPREGHRERQPDVAQAHHAHRGGAALRGAPRAGTRARRAASPAHHLGERPLDRVHHLVHLRIQELGEARQATAPRRRPGWPPGSRGPRSAARRAAGRESCSGSGWTVPTPSLGQGRRERVPLGRPHRELMVDVPRRAAAPPAARAAARRARCGSGAAMRAAALVPVRQALELHAEQAPPAARRAGCSRPARRAVLRRLTP